MGGFLTLAGVITVAAAIEGSLRRIMKRRLARNELDYIALMIPAVGLLELYTLVSLGPSPSLRYTFELVQRGGFVLCTAVAVWQLIRAVRNEPR